MITLTSKVLGACKTLTAEQAKQLLTALADGSETTDQAVNILILMIEGENEKKAAISKKRSKARLSALKTKEPAKEPVKPKKESKPLQERIDEFEKDSQEVLGARGATEYEIQEFVKYWTEYSPGSKQFRAEKEKNFDKYRRFERYNRMFGGKKPAQQTEKKIGRQTEETLIANHNNMRNAFLYD